MFCWPCCVMLAGTPLYIRLLVYAGLSLFIISGLYVYMVVCVVYAYNLTNRVATDVMISSFSLRMIRHRMKRCMIITMINYYKSKNCI